MGTKLEEARASLNLITECLSTQDQGIRILLMLILKELEDVNGNLRSLDHMLHALYERS